MAFENDFSQVVKKTWPPLIFIKKEELKASLRPSPGRLLFDVASTK